MAQNVCITGGAGFIGAHVARALLDRGDTVTIIDDFGDFLYSPSLKQAREQHLLNQITKPTIIRGDILNEADLTQAITPGTDVVLHLAAHANPGKSIDHAAAYTTTNVVGTLRVLEAAQRAGVKQIIFAGSSSVYNDEHTPFQEDAYPLRPRSPYGTSKAAAELYCQLWHELYGMSVTILRFFSVYGPWGRPDMAPMIFAEKILTNEPIALTKEDRQRDFTSIGDAVPAILAAIDTPFDYEIINIGHGQPVKLTALIHALEKAAGQTATIVERSAPEGEMRVTYADITKAKQLLGYEPRVSLQTGAAELITWMQEQYLAKS